MAALLRSSKFTRFFSNFVRNVTFSNGNRTDPDTLLCQRREEWEITLFRSFATVQLPQKGINDSSANPNTVSGNSIDRALYRADLDIKKLGRLTRKDVENIVNEIKLLKKATTTQSLLIIRCCGNLVPEEPPEVRTQLVQEIWKTLENLGVILDISHYNALLRVYLENEHVFNPEEFLQLLETKKIEPNRVTYQRLISAYCQRGDIDGASKILETMKNNDLPINENVFNALVMGHARTGDHESAKGIIKVMEQAGLEATTDTYTALLCGYAKYGLLQDIINTINECRQKDIIFYDKDLLEVLYMAAVNGHSPLVEDLLGKMNKASGYNQDCVNIILRLINSGCEDIAFKLLLSMKPVVLPDGQLGQTGGFFIRQIVKSKRPVNTIIYYCDELVKRGLNIRAYLKALDAANNFGYTELVEQLLVRIKNQKEMIRPQLFWPLFITQSKVNGEKGVFDVLRQMASLDVTPNVETVNNHVLPHVTGNSISAIARKLRAVDVPSSVVGSSLMLQSLQQHDFTSALEVTNLYTIRMENPILRKAFAQAFIKTKDANAAGKLLLSLVGEKDEATGEYPSADKIAEIIGPILIEVLQLAPKPKINTIQPFLSALFENGLGISNSTAQFVQEKLDENMTETVAKLLEELSSGQLRPVAIDDHSAESKLENRALRKKANFSRLAREHKLEELLAYKQTLEAEKFILSTGMQVLLLDTYAFHGQTENAWDIYSQLVAQDPDFVMDPLKTLRLAGSLVKDGREEQALKVLERLKLKDSEIAEPSVALTTAVWRILSTAAEKGNVEVTKQLFDAIEKSKVVEITAFILGPLVKCHLVRDDLDSALSTFAHCVKTYNCTPLKSPLTVRLIEKEDAQHLQELMDLSVQVHGEMNSLYDLVFAFLDCGRVRQARKVLETPGLRARHQRLETACQRYVEESRIEELENLVKITKDLFDIDRHMLFNYMLTAYMNKKDTEKALGLWTQMQEENVQPTEEFLRILGEFLKKNNVHVPFAIPETEVDTPTSASSEPVPETITTPLKQFRQALKEGNVDAALAKYEELQSSGKQLNVTDLSSLIEVVVRVERLGIATRLVTDMLRKQLHPLPQIFRFYIGRLAKSGDAETLQSLSQYLSPEMKRMIAFDNSLCAALSQDSSASSEYVDSLLNEAKKVSELTAEDERIKALEDIQAKFPRGGLLALLERNPQLVDRCKQLADIYLKLGIAVATNSMWCHYMISGHTEEATSAWAILKTHSGPIGFQPICRHIREKNDDNLAEKLMNILSESQYVTTSALGVAYSAWVDVLCNKGSPEEALSLLKTAVNKGIKLEEINRTSLVNVKKALEKNAQSFPFTIPSKKRKHEAQSSSSSSDSDGEQQR